MIDEETGEISVDSVQPVRYDVLPRVGPFVRSAYNYDMDAASEASGLCCMDETLTQQSFKEECDINTIVRNFGVTGQLPEGVHAMPLPSDFQETMDYRESLHVIMEADKAFHAYPAELRARFMNDPARFIEFVNNPDNAEEARKWGLLREKDKAPEPMIVKMWSDPNERLSVDPTNVSK